LQFAIRTSKASRPRRTPGTALPVRKAARVQAVTCLAQLAQPRKARVNPGRDGDHHSPAVTQATPTPTLLRMWMCRTWFRSRTKYYHYSVIFTTRMKSATFLFSLLLFWIV